MVQFLHLIAIPRRSRSLIIVLFIALVVTVARFTGGSDASTRHEDAESQLSMESDPDNSEILLVSAYFPESNSKREYEDSIMRLSGFLGQISTHVYFYTSTDFAPTIQTLRGHLPITINTTFEGPFDISVIGSRRSNYMSTENVTSQMVQAYAFSNVKPHLLAEAARSTQALTSASYKYMFWVDADSFKGRHAYRDWPSLGRLNEVWTDGRRESGAKHEDMVFIPMWDLPKVDFLLWKEEKGPITEDFSQESMFGGLSKSIFWFERYYFAYLNHYLDLGFQSVGQGEALMNSLLLLHPENFITVWHGDPVAPSAVDASLPDTEHVLGDCGDPRFYFQFFLASSAERKQNREIWDGVWNWKFWEFEKWTRVRETCRLTRILAMQWTLRRRFGDMWRSPAQSVVF